VEELALYDTTRDDLRNRLAGRFPADFDLESTVTAYAYWVCTVIRNHGKDWESTVQEYVDFALRDALLEAQAEKTEVELLRRELAGCTGLLLDVGAGWGRYASLYAACGLEAVYVEPSDLGCRLLRRNALTHSARCRGQSLCFPDSAFQSAVIGWVLHHDALDVPSAAILGEIARVMSPEGCLLSIEPLSSDFDAPKWRGLIEAAGFEVKKLESFFDLSSSEKMSEQYACLAAMSRADCKHG
jgi:ubiquinone/menaquinone biosynthesis C-methylase UbiE